ncbi:MAG: hypothetical protein EBT03_12080 [Betaproteobacteria bacterium]|nr:hypothetical protein [Betaproteobacteria bacterium]
MAMTYGVTAGVSQNVGDNSEYVFVTGTSGNIVKHFKKYRRIETVTETLPDTFAHPVMSPPSAGGFRKELRCSNTDFARLSVTAITFGTIV